MSRVISIDPGQHHAGIAAWTDGVLRRAWLIGPDKSRWLALLDQIRGEDSNVDVVVCETQVYYPGSPVRVNDLINLAAVAGAVAATFNGRTYVPASPPVWTRGTTTNKDVRLRRAWERLTVEERTRVELPKSALRQADVLDAIALGLWYLKRW